MNTFSRTFITPILNRNIWDRLFDFSILAIAASLILPIGVNSVCIIISFFLWIFLKEYVNLKDLLQNKLAIAFISFYSIHLVSTLCSGNLDQAIFDIFERKISYIFLPVLLINRARIERLKYSIFRSFYITLFLAILYCAYCSFIDYSDGLNAHKVLENFSYNNFSNHIKLQPIYFSFLVIISFFLILRDNFLNFNLSFCTNKIIFISFIFVLILFFHYLAIIFLSSRTEIITFLLVGFLLVLKIAYVRKNIVAGFFFIFIVFSISILTIVVNDTNKERFLEMIDIKSDYTSNKWGGRSFRLLKWKYSMQLWEKNKLFGVGTGDYQSELNKIYDKNNFSLASSGNYNSHNQFIQTLTTLGITGFLSLVFIFYVLFVAYFKQKDWIILAFTLICMLSMVTESMLERNKGLIPFIFFTIILYDFGKKK